MERLWGATIPCRCLFDIVRRGGSIGKLNVPSFALKGVKLSLFQEFCSKVQGAKTFFLKLCEFLFRSVYQPLFF